MDVIDHTKLTSFLLGWVDRRREKLNQIFPRTRSHIEQSFPKERAMVVHVHYKTMWKLTKNRIQDVNVYWSTKNGISGEIWSDESGSIDLAP